MRVILWLLALLFAAVSIGIVSFLLRPKVPTSFVSKLTASDVLNIFLFVVAVISLYVAVATYIDARESGEKQQESLDTSRKALEQMVDSAKSQITVLNGVQATLNAELAILNEHNKRELERLGKKPQLEFLAVNNVSAEQVSKGPVSIDASMAGKLVLIFRNIGNIAVVRPVAVFVASPATILVAQPGASIPQYQPNILQVGGPQTADMQPYSESKTDYNYPLALTIPAEVSEVELSYTFGADNLSKWGGKIRFVISRPH